MAHGAEELGAPALSLLHGRHVEDRGDDGGEGAVRGVNRLRVDQRGDGRAVWVRDHDLLGMHRVAVPEHLLQRDFGEPVLPPIRTPEGEGLEEHLQGVSTPGQPDNPPGFLVDRLHRAVPYVEDDDADR